MKISIRPPLLDDEQSFLAAVARSKALHQPWTMAPSSSVLFREYIGRYSMSDQKSWLVCAEMGEIAGVFNVNEIVRGCFQSGYLGFYAMSPFEGKGLMSAGLKLVLEAIFNELGLHRVEANIQPENARSLGLVMKNGFRYEGFSPRYLRIDEEWKGHERWAITVEDYIKDSPEVTDQDFVEIVPYNPDWPKMAKNEIEKLRISLPFKIMDIQHVGSTSIPGISAKPVIDIQIAVHSLQDIQFAAIQGMQKMGYEFWVDNPEPNRMFFVRGMPPFGQRRTHHVHVFEYDSESWRNKIIFRDYLRTHPDDARAYEKLKYTLAKAHLLEREKYTDAKQAFVNDILKKNR